MKYLAIKTRNHKDQTIFTNLTDLLDTYFPKLMDATIDAEQTGKLKDPARRRLYRYLAICGMPRIFKMARYDDIDNLTNPYDEKQIFIAFYQAVNIIWPDFLEITPLSTTPHESTIAQAIISSASYKKLIH